MYSTRTYRKSDRRDPIPVTKTKQTNNNSKEEEEEGKTAIFTAAKQVSFAATKST